MTAWARLAAGPTPVALVVPRSLPTAADLVALAGVLGCGRWSLSGRRWCSSAPATPTAGAEPLSSGLAAGPAVGSSLGPDPQAWNRVAEAIMDRVRWGSGSARTRGWSSLSLLSPLAGRRRRGGGVSRRPGRRVGQFRHQRRAVPRPGRFHIRPRRPRRPEPGTSTARQASVGRRPLAARTPIRGAPPSREAPRALGGGAPFPLPQRRTRGDHPADRAPPPVALPSASPHRRIRVDALGVR